MMRNWHIRHQIADAQARPTYFFAQQKDWKSLKEGDLFLSLTDWYWGQSSETVLDDLVWKTIPANHYQSYITLTWNKNEDWSWELLQVEIWKQ